MELHWDLKELSWSCSMCQRDRGGFGNRSLGSVALESVQLALDTCYSPLRTRNKVLQESLPSKFRPVGLYLISMCECDMNGLLGKQIIR